MSYRIYYLVLRVLSALRYAVAKWFTPAGKLALAGLISSAIIGLDTNINTAYQAFTLLAALFLAAFIGSRFFRPAFTAHRVLPRFGTAGQTLTYQLHIRATGGMHVRGLTFHENLQDPRPLFADFRDQAKAGIALGWNWFRGDSYYRYWKQLVAANRIADPISAPLSDLRPGTGIEMRMEIVPLKRGRLQFTSAAISRTDPFGLLNTYAAIPLMQSMLVLPKRYAIPDISLPGTRAYQHGGVSQSTSVADSEEFQSLREYRPGDPVRLIHWKSMARVGKPVIKEYQDEFFVRHALVLDTFMTRELHGVFEEAVSVAASFACTVQTQESLLDLMFVGAEAYCETAGRGQGQTEHLLEVLAGVRACTDKPFSVLHQHVVSRRASLSGCICILLDWDEPRKKFIDHLTRLNVPTLVLVLADSTRSPASDLLPGTDRPAWLHVLETGKVEEGLARL